MSFISSDQNLCIDSLLLLDVLLFNSLVFLDLDLVKSFLFGLSLVGELLEFFLVLLE